MRGEAGFFDVDERLRRLSDLGDQLLEFAAAVDFEIFRAELSQLLAYSDGSQGGQPPFDPVLMFKVLVIHARTIWLFREKLTRAGAIQPLFVRFDVALRQAGYIAMGGQIVDASLVAAPKPIFYSSIS